MPVTVTLLNAPVGVVLSGTLSAPTAAGGVATFANLAVSGPAAGAPGFEQESDVPRAEPPPVQSEPFDVGIAPPTNLFFIHAAHG